MEKFLDNIISEDVFTETDNLRLNLIEYNLLLLFVFSGHRRRCCTWSGFSPTFLAPKKSPKSVDRSFLAPPEKRRRKELFLFALAFRREDDLLFSPNREFFCLRLASVVSPSRPNRPPSPVPSESWPSASRNLRVHFGF